VTKTETGQSKYSKHWTMQHKERQIYKEKGDILMTLIQEI